MFNAMQAAVPFTGKQKGLKRGVQANNGAPMGMGQPPQGGLSPEVLGLSPEMEGRAQGGVQPTQGPVSQFNAPQAPDMPAPGGLPQGPSFPMGNPGGVPQSFQPREVRDQLKYGRGPGAIEGFNTSDYGGDIKARNSVKNTFGRIASKYEANPMGLDALLQDEEFKQFFPGAFKEESSAGDRINFGGILSDFESGVPVYSVDVGRLFDPKNNTGQAWVWQDLVNDAQGPAPGNAIYNQAQNTMGTPGGQGMMAQLESLDDSTLMALLEQLMQQGEQPVELGGGSPQMGYF